MKNTLKLLLVAFLLFSVVGCNKEKKKEEDPVVVKDDTFAGYVKLRPAGHVFEIQTPENWINISTDDTANLVDEVVKLLDEGKIPTDMIANIKSGDLVYFIDLGNLTEGFAPNLTIVKTFLDASVKQSDLPLIIPLMTEEFEQNAEASGLKNFNWIQKPFGKTIGSNYFVIYEAEYSVMNVETVGYQALTIDRGNAYHFTYTTTPEKATAESYATFEKVLSSLKFD